MITSRKRRSNFFLTNQTDRVGKKGKSRFGIDTFILVPAGALIVAPQLSIWRRHLHSHPELSYEEYETMKAAVCVYHEMISVSECLPNRLWSM